MSGSKIRAALLGASLIACPVAAFAGPCSADIASVGKQLSQSSALGPVTSGTLSGSNSGNADQPAPTATSTAGTSASNKVGGTAGTKELDAASSNIATSDADVRQQQMGHRTAAGKTMQGGTETSPGSQSASNATQGDHMSRAKAAWQKAVDLNAQNDDSCHGAIDQARSAMKAS